MTHEMSHSKTYVPWNRFAIAIKVPNQGIGVELFLDEAKSMLEIGEYHDNIVNLQGICYSIDEETRSLSNVCIVEMFEHYLVILWNNETLENN